jgi:uncharacterized lipoprotein YmbA
MSKFEYKILEQAEKPEDCLIQKTGTKDIDQRFTLAQMVSNQNEIVKVIKEKEAQAAHHNAEMKNVELNHPDVKKLDEKLQQAAYVFVEARINRDSALEVAKRYKEAADEQQQEIDAIVEALKLPTPVINE